MGPTATSIKLKTLNGNHLFRVPFKMNILFSSDDYYAQHMGVAIYSLLSHNMSADEICIYVIDNEISTGNKDKLELIIKQFPNSQIIFIPFKKWKDSLTLNMAWNISISSYGRLFVGSMLPVEVCRVIYLDCDMVVRSSLEKLWNTDMSECALAAVQDDVTDGIKVAVTLSPGEQYFNAGMLLIDLEKWREEEIEDKCMNFIKERGGRVIHHDQGVLNGVFRNKWYRLPLEDNLMTIHYVFNRKQILKYFGEHSEFYSDVEITSAKQNPVILHYTPSFTSRPWVKGCNHPLRYLYWDILAKTPWAGAKPQKDNTRWYLKIINWKYRNLPF